MGGDQGIVEPVGDDAIHAFSFNVPYFGQRIVAGEVDDVKLPATVLAGVARDAVQDVAPRPESETQHNGNLADFHLFHNGSHDTIYVRTGQTGFRFQVLARVDVHPP